MHFPCYHEENKDNSDQVQYSLHLTCFFLPPDIQSTKRVTCKLKKQKPFFLNWNWFIWLRRQSKWDSSSNSQIYPCQFLAVRINKPPGFTAGVRLFHMWNLWHGGSGKRKKLNRAGSTLPKLLSRSVLLLGRRISQWLKTPLTLPEILPQGSIKPRKWDPATPIPLLSYLMWSWKKCSIFFYKFKNNFVLCWVVVHCGIYKSS
jgi:hypothetical protein